MTYENAVQISKVDRLVVRLVRKRGKVGRLLLQLVGVDIPTQVQIGDDLRIPHSTSGLVMHWKVRIGNRVTVMPFTVLGRAEPWASSLSADDPSGIVVEDDVVIGAGAAVLFRAGQTLTLGRGCVVGANAVVTQSIEPGEVWAGNPARKVGNRE